MQLLTDVQVVDKKAVDCTRDFFPGLFLIPFNSIFHADKQKKILFYFSLIVFKQFPSPAKFFATCNIEKCS